MTNLIDKQRDELQSRSVKVAAMGNNANARLIAAAPELLATLHRIVNRINNLPDDSLTNSVTDTEFIIRRDARLAIAKAEGRDE